MAEPTDTAAHYALDADPADNPHQPPADEQGTHHPGAHNELRRLAALKEAEVSDGDR